MNMVMAPVAHDPLSWFIVVVGSIVCVYTFLAAGYWLVRPGETDPAHPKMLIFKENR